jgi:hypothetical protein
MSAFTSLRHRCFSQIGVIPTEAIASKAALHFSSPRHSVQIDAVTDGGSTRGAIRSSNAKFAHNRWMVVRSALEDALRAQSGYFEKLQEDDADPDIRVRFRDWESPETGTVGNEQLAPGGVTMRRGRSPASPIPVDIRARAEVARSC